VEVRTVAAVAVGRLTAVAVELPRAVKVVRNKAQAHHPLILSGEEGVNGPLATQQLLPEPDARFFSPHRPEFARSRRI
jgi:hypothetical protein